MAAQLVITEPANRTNNPATIRATIRTSIKWISGVLQAGKAADFVILDANPLDDINNTRQISAVYLRGQAVDREGWRARWTAEKQ